MFKSNFVWKKYVNCCIACLEYANCTQKVTLLSLSAKTGSREVVVGKHSLWEGYAFAF